MGWSPFRSRGELVNNIQGAMHDSVTDYGLPQTLDALAFVCREWAKWSLQDREIKQAKQWDRAADKLHALSLEVSG